MDTEQLKKEIEQYIDHNLQFKIYRPDNQSAPVLLILDYVDTNNESNVASFALSLQDYPQFSNNKCWITERKLKPVDGSMPRYYPDYKAFDYCGKKFHPFSVNINRYSIQNIHEILRSLYNHIDWES